MSARKAERVCRYGLFVGCVSECLSLAERRRTKGDLRFPTTERFFNCEEEGEAAARVGLVHFSTGLVP